MASHAILCHAIPCLAVPYRSTVSETPMPATQQQHCVVGWANAQQRERKMYMCVYIHIDTHTHYTHVLVAHVLSVSILVMRVSGVKRDVRGQHGFTPKAQKSSSTRLSRTLHSQARGKGELRAVGSSQGGGAGGLGLLNRCSIQINRYIDRCKIHR